MSTDTPAKAVGGGWFHYRRSLASRVTLLTTMAVGLTVAFLAAGAYVTVRMQLQSTLDDTLMERAYQTTKAPTLIDRRTGDELPAWAVLATDLRIAVVFSDGSTPYRPEKLDDAPRLGSPELAVARGEAKSSIRTVVGGDQEYRAVTVPYGDGQALVIAQSLEGQQRVLTKLGVVMATFGLLGVLAAGMAGWGVARNGLRPVRRLTSSVERIARTEDLTPLPVEGDDEIARLASAFNQMLLALGASRDRQRQLVADAGHELRTPLTSLRTNVDLLTQASSPGGPDLPTEARAELLDDIRAQIEELTTLIGDLVELARDEPLARVVEPVDLTGIVDHAISRVRLRAPSLTFDVDAEPWWVVGEASGLERAVTNLLDNAAKWSPPGGRVTVRLTRGVLIVDDEGPGIAEADRPHVFDRFWRADESRGLPGSGLGLSIVRQVAERHSGSVEATVAPGGGARLVMWLPGSEEPAPPPPPDPREDAHA
ncbi:HAMP domain-containing histidine kinase [Nocardioides sp. cx-169]|uniref:HAMP domain-containing sensor histidine kinase n=1 Tax=Nocardioides sp. cx-169 TaxID=2899080 RepID=UPI001E42AE3A|nr:HAMP domain-containing sensor histidine kinase [Nocardioides sp. cx-169]MCD4533268.1 HAMP domain-containing histidine kinase [Nocardioides sp. cx-169]